MSEAHDPATCPTCGPYVNSEAYQRGLAKAAEAAKRAERDE